MLDFPEIELKIRGMERTIIAAVQDYNKDLQAKVSEEVSKVISTYDFESEVKVQAEKAIKEAVGASISNLIGYQLRQEITQMVRDAIASKLNKQKDETA